MDSVHRSSRSRGSRRARGLAAACAAVAAGAVAVLAPASAAAFASPAPKADRDGDRVHDDLERRLAGKPASASVRVIVTLDTEATRQRVGAIGEGVGADVRSRFGEVGAFAAEVRKDRVDELSKRPGVAAVEADSTVRALDRAGQDAFGVSAARAQAPHLDGDRDGRRGTYTPRDMVAAVVDTGIDTRHRDLDDRKVIAFVDCTTGSCRARGALDDNGHGTHIAATLAGTGDARPDRLYRGVAPNAALVGVKVLGAAGFASKSAVVAGVDWTIANRRRYGIEAMNLSLGDSGCSAGNDAMSRAANRAYSSGIVTVAAAGNDGPEPCTINSPAAAAGAIAVGAMRHLGQQGFLAWWLSGRGIPGGRIKPGVMAPGIDVVSARFRTAARYWRKTGTSTAAPFVTGVALLIRDARPSLSPAEVRKRIRSTAVDWGLGGDGRTAGSRGPDIDFGWGRLDAYAALRAAGVNALTQPPRLPVHGVLEGRMNGSGWTCSFDLDVADTRHPIAGSLIMPTWRDNPGSPGYVDFDLYLKNPAGNVVAKEESIERQDDVVHRPSATGTYRIEVKSHTGSANFFVDVSAGLAGRPRSEPTSCTPPS
jgi:serine protease AprX